MQLWQALILGALQGISELFPISSLGHLALIPALLGWTVSAGTLTTNCANLKANSFVCYEGQDQFLAFAVALHLATALALLFFFWREWLVVVKAIIGSVTRRQFVYDRESKFAWLLVAATIPTGILGLLLEKPVRNLFTNPLIIAVFLIANGFIMLLGEYLRRRSLSQLETNPALAVTPAAVAATTTTGSVGGGGTTYSSPKSSNPLVTTSKSSEDLSFSQSVGIGLAQSLALLPGISRSGAAMVAGLFAGLTHEEAARFAFMLATPVIGLAALYKVPSLFKGTTSHDILGLAVAGALVAGICAYISVRFLMRYFETKSLAPFGYYSIVAGVAAFILLLIQK